MKNIITLLALIISVFSFAQLSQRQSVTDSLNLKKNINSDLKFATQQIYIKNNGFKKEINYFSKEPFGENTIGYDLKRDKMKNSFIESFVNILLNSKNNK